MLKLFSVFLLNLILAGCGGVQKAAYGLEESAKLVIRSEALVGTTVSVGDQFSLVVAKKNLTPFKMGILGSKDTENENLETLVFEIDSGTARVLVTNGQSKIFDKKLYFSKGQTRVLRLHNEK